MTEIPLTERIGLLEIASLTFSKGASLDFTNRAAWDQASG